MRFRACKILLLSFAAASLSFADVSLIIEEAVGGAGEFTGSGHAAVYFSGICPDTPVSLRLCRDGEKGVVLSAYPDWGQEVPYRWIAMPFHPFLYGVDDPRKVPLYANGEVRTALRDAYRKQYLRTLVPDNRDGTVPDGRWREIIGTTLNRDVYTLTVKTTRQQDEQFLKSFLAIPNEYAFNTMFNNCADFARETLNLVFPHSTGRDYLNDFGITTPKALARSFTEFAAERPELAFHIERYPQIDGVIRRSLNNRNFTEKALVSKKYFLTMLTTKPEVLGGFLTTYFITGYYSLDGRHHDRPTAEVANLKSGRAGVMVASTSPTVPSAAAAEKLAKKEVKQIRTNLFGDNQYWNAHRKQFSPLLDAAFKDRLFLDKDEFKKFYKDMELQSEPITDAEGGLMLRVEDRGGVLRNVGITSANILSPESDLTLAYKILLAKVNYALTAPPRNRLTVPAFEQEWALLQSAADRWKRETASSEHEADRSPEPQPFRTHEPVTTGSKRAQKLLMELTH